MQTLLEEDVSGEGSEHGGWVRDYSLIAQPGSTREMQELLECTSVGFATKGDQRVATAAKLTPFRHRDQ
jgi:hypothetical protein